MEWWIYGGYRPGYRCSQSTVCHVMPMSTSNTRFLETTNALTIPNGSLISSAVFIRPVPYFPHTVGPTLAYTAPQHFPQNFSSLQRDFDSHMMVPWVYPTYHVPSGKNRSCRNFLELLPIFDGQTYHRQNGRGTRPVKLEPHGTDTDTDTDIRDAPIV